MGWLPNQIKLFQALLYCYPAEFRHEYGAEMKQLFASRLQSEPQLRLWLETIADVMLSATKEHWLTLVSDVRYGARVLAAAPGFTATAMLVIALGIGSTASIFSLVNAVLLRSLPYGHSEELVYLWSPNPNFKGVPQELSPNAPDFYEWQRLAHSFSSMSIFRLASVSVVQSGSSHRVGSALVSASFFQTLRINPRIGRTLNDNDEQPGHEHVAVISDLFWRSQFASKPDILGTELQLNRRTYTVVGVMPDGFGYPFDGDVPYEHSGFKQTDIWLPAPYSAAQKVNRADFVSGDVIARLRDGVSPKAAQAELSALEAHLQPLYPAIWRGWTAFVKPLVQTIFGPVEQMLWLLLGAVAIVMLVAVSNVANLLLARSAARAQEMGIRTALGAERGRIIRQLLTESLMLSLGGGLLGIGLAYAAVHALTQLNPGNVPRFESTSVDARVLFVAVVLSFVTGVLAGAMPAIAATRTNINVLLRSGGSRVTGSSNIGRFALIVLEVALSMVLLTASGLLIRSYLKLAAVSPGFSQAAVTFKVHLDERYNTPQLSAALYKQFLAKLQQTQGVTYVGASSSTPLSNNESLTFAEVHGFGKAKDMVENRSTTPDYRKALGTQLLRGHDFETHDVNSKPPVVMVNEKFVKEYFRDRDPIGGQIRIGIGDLSNAPWATVVAVVSDVRHNSLEEQVRPALFQPTDGAEYFALQSTASTSQVVEQARSALRALDPVLTLEGISTMRQRMDDSNARRKFQTTLLTGFAAIAVTLALVGLYGLIAYSVKQRTAEIGLRLAIGSSRSRILWLILSQGLRLTGYGLIIGLGGSFALTRLLSGSLFEVAATDPGTFVVMPIFIMVVACCACLIPAWSATRIDPVRALAQD